MSDPLALVPLSPSSIGSPSPGTAPVRFAAPPTVRARTALCGLGGAVLLAMALLTAGLPALSMCVLAVAGVSSFVFGSIEPAPGAGARRVLPEELLSIEVRTPYHAVLRGLAAIEAEIEHVRGDAPRRSTALMPVLERCRAAVQLSGRIALMANPIQRYLEAHDACATRAQLELLRARAGATRDDAAVSALHRAADTLARQLAIVDEIVARRDRITAQLELVHAALDGFAAMIVKLHALEDEQVVLAHEPLADQLAAIDDDLDVLAEALEPGV